MSRVAVVILNWNGERFLREYLPKVLSTTDASVAEVIVADNGSTDGSIALLQNEFSEVRVIAFDRNYGFADGYNKAIEAIDNEYVVLLNSDVETTAGWIGKMVTFMDAHPEVAACQPKIRQISDRGSFEFAGAAGGFIDALGYPFCRGRILNNLERDEAQYDSTIQIFWATGAALFIRRDDYIKAGGLDGEFFAHQEEIDLCWRLNARGRLLVCLPDAVVYHVGGGTLNASNPFKTYLNFRNNLLMLYKNMTGSRLWWVMVVRFVLDYLSALIFLLQGKRGDCAAVFRARFNFWSMRQRFAGKRRENIRLTINRMPACIYRSSILMSLYFGGKRKFSQLRWDDDIQLL